MRIRKKMIIYISTANGQKLSSRSILMISDVYLKIIGIYEDGISNPEVYQTKTR